MKKNTHQVELIIFLITFLDAQWQLSYLSANLWYDLYAVIISSPPCEPNMASIIHQPSDKLFKLSMAELAIATEFFKTHLPAHLLEKIDLSSLKCIPLRIPRRHLFLNP